MRPRSQISRELQTIRDSVLSLQGALTRLAAAPTGKGPKPAPPTRKLRLSPARRAALKLQGAYIGTMRGLGVRQRAQVKALRASKGMPAAIALAKRLAKAA